ncbi:hypothetical protein [Spirosoma endophyticum]|uniref:Transposase n=1 Tax=Spirosoma endophyticum TaxID=662367 RepID=A0A1I1TWB8_9BACT|nr:hypothetical protein [Spirosoma endophyticum]SFD62804.1 hypothetical protein SAMN05216167_10619 [Spirosoma endophyticum]
MSKIRRSFIPEDRYSIVQEAIRDGHAEICRKYNGMGHPAIPFVTAQVALEIPEQRKRRPEGLYLLLIDEVLFF